MPRSCCPLPILAVFLLTAASTARAQLTQAEERAITQSEERLQQALDAELKARADWMPLPAEFKAARDALDLLLKDPNRDPAEVKRLTRIRDAAGAAEFKAREGLNLAVDRLKTARTNLNQTNYNMTMRVANRAAVAGNLSMALDESLKATGFVRRGSPQWNSAAVLALQCNSALTIMEVRRNAREAGGAPDAPKPAKEEEKEKDLRDAFREAQKERWDLLKEKQQERLEKLKEDRARERERERENNKKNEKKDKPKQGK